ncbi:ABC transporter substrate-binding protein [Cytobacillus gottheilii]|uniref:ABC transporter substrate-binding protein n=1 Tax=Cytobacillus gottheilii TaxID=859144 RepID=UPI000831479F|nr:extracellular solute-binding protein [Cytobacillus gottheilii]
MRNIILLSLMILVVAACSIEPNITQEKRMKKLEFFSVKEETRPIFEQLILEFEARYQDIQIEQVIVPNGMAVLKNRMARGDAPDLFISYPLEQDYIIRVKNGYLLDITRELFLDRVQPTIQQRYSVDGRMYGAAFTQNSVGVLYNKQLFRELNLPIPVTWDEWVKTLETLQASGVNPLLMPNEEPEQTSIVTLNFVANRFPPAFWTGDLHLKDQQEWVEINEKIKTLLSYTSRSSFVMGYDEANKAFAQGKGAMYIMGTWSLPMIEKLNPDLEYGIFPVPVSNLPAENRVLGGVDIGISISSATEFPIEAKLFLAFLTEQENAQRLSLYEGSVSTIIGSQETKEVLSLISKKVQDGDTVNWPNHYWLGGTRAETEYRLHTLQYFKDLDGRGYLSRLEEMFRTYSNEEQTP